MSKTRQQRFLSTLAWGNPAFHKLGTTSHHVQSIPSTPALLLPLPTLALSQVKSLACGVSHSLALVQHAKKGFVFSWGSNYYGQLGHLAESTSFFALEDDEDEFATPTLIKRLISTSSPTAPTTTTTTSSSSRNHDTHDDHSTPIDPAKDLPLAENSIVDIACGNFHSLALTADGHLMAWGAGILGNGAELYDSNPQRIKLFADIGRRVVAMAAGGDATIAICVPITKTNNDSHASHHAPPPPLPPPSPEIYVWGYINTSSGETVKSLSPIVVRHALFHSLAMNDEMSGSGLVAVAKGRGGYAGCNTFAILLNRESSSSDASSSFLALYGKPTSLDQLSSSSSSSSSSSPSSSSLWTRLVDSWIHSAQERNLKSHLASSTSSSSSTSYPQRLTPEYPFMRKVPLTGGEGGVYEDDPFATIDTTKCGRVKQICLGEEVVVLLNNEGRVWMAEYNSSSSLSSSLSPVSLSLVELPISQSCDDDKIERMDIGGDGGDYQTLTLATRTRLWNWDLITGNRGGNQEKKNQPYLLYKSDNLSNNQHDDQIIKCLSIGFDHGLVSLDGKD